MPFKSNAQRKFLFANHLAVAHEFAKHTPKGKKLPEHVKKKSHQKYAADDATPIAGKEEKVIPKDTSWGNVEYDPSQHHPVVSPKSQWNLQPGHYSNIIWNVQHPELGNYFVKRPQHNPEEAHTEPAAREILRSLGFDTPPIERFHHPGAGVNMLAGPWRNVTTLAHASDTGKEAELLGKVPKQEIGNLLTAEWLLHAADRHGNNYGVNEKGRLMPLDYGETFHPLPWESIPEEYRNETYERHVGPAYSDLLSAATEHRILNKHYPLDKNFIRRLLESKPTIHAILAKHGVPEAFSPKARDNMMRLLSEKFGILSRLHDMPNPRLRDLPEYQGTKRL